MSKDSSRVRTDIAPLVRIEKESGPDSSVLRVFAIAPMPEAGKEGK